LQTYWKAQHTTCKTFNLKALNKTRKINLWSTKSKLRSAQSTVEAAQHAIHATSGLISNVTSSVRGNRWGRLIRLQSRRRLLEAMLPVRDVTRLNY